jgi:hypothetical protein
MAEWSKAHAWKVCKRQKRFMGSNPILSAHNNNCFFSFLTKAFSVTMNKKFFSKIMIYFGLAMVVIFLGLGITLMFLPYFPFIPKDLKTIMGFFFLVYGIFRLIRIIMELKDFNNFYENNN